MVDGFTEKERLGELVQMNVTQLGDMEAIEGLRKVGKSNFGMGDLSGVARDFAGIERQTRGAGEACREEATTRQRKSR